MTNATKWTVRNIDPTALEMLQEVRTVTGQPMGALISEAVTEWYSRLPEITDEDDDGADQDRITTGLDSLKQLLRQWRGQSRQQVF